MAKTKKTELDKFLEFLKKESKDAPYAVKKRIGDYLFSFRVSKK